MQSNLAILGSTGSVGEQTLDIVRRHPEKYRVSSLVAHSSVEKIFHQICEFRPELAAVAEPEAARELEVRLAADTRSAHRTVILAGEESAVRAVTLPAVNTVVAAIVGFPCLLPVIEAIKAGKNIAQANKEVMVAAGDLVNSLISEYRTRMVPVDSEHNAVFQCMLGRGAQGVRKVTVMATGGPLLHCSREELQDITPSRALAHPRWSMGPKISIDSSTLMNKGLEVIEAAKLFNLPAEKIEVIVNPQAIIHAMVEYEDSSVVALLYEPDMRVPIAFALDYLAGFPVSSTGSKQLNLAELGRLDFYLPDLERFPSLALCYKALRLGGGTTAALNAANEIAVEAFLAERLGFMQMVELVEKIVDLGSWGQGATLSDVLAIDSKAREAANKILKEELIK